MPFNAPHFRSLIQAKLRALAIHLSISALAVGALAYATLAIWYPDGLASLQGVWKILGLVVLVDVVLGPALTFIVYAPRKRTLALDLSVIAVIQLAALVYGGWIIASQKPEYLAYMYDRFFVVKQGDLMGETPQEILELPRWHGGPRVVFVRLSLGAQMEAARMAQTAFDTPAMALLPGGYAPLGAHTGQLMVSDLANTGRPSDGTARFRVIGREGMGVATVDLQSGELLEIRTAAD